MSSRLVFTAVALLGLLIATPCATATQHLISPGQSWERAISRARPGDEIILMPGRHDPVTISDLKGTNGKRIVIRSADPDHPSVIAGRQYGMRLVRPSYVTIKDIIVTGAKITGIAIDNQKSIFAVTDGELNPERWDCHVKLENVVIRGTGPTGERHAVSCLGVENVEIDSCHFDGWGGAAIEVHGTRNVVVENCYFRGRPDHSQRFGIRVRGGSASVLVDRCTFENAGTRVISLGGTTKGHMFIPPLTTDESDEPRYEATRVRVLRNRFVGGDVVFTFDHCGQSMVRNNTVVRPRICVFSLLDSAGDDEAAPPLAATSETIVGFNLIVWQAEDLRRLGHASENAPADGIKLRSNLWWSPETAEERARLGEIPWVTQRDPQVTDLDPQLDERLKPQNGDAELYGAHAP